MTALPSVHPAGFTASDIRARPAAVDTDCRELTAVSAG
ncbi:hypothetical protein Ga0074812_124130 [Parafrankia irregularis]|uniref:Uncharacterized protein n=1 Tax=Parafrankia irregularis TaxID=795642 RepID=A0A0S4QU35_9ACTN|nr:hypothetical protein Ga0074812_124130 [Parafrankia irregularis]